MLMSDDFEDGAFTWNADPRHWRETGGELVGTSGRALAPVPWIPSGATGCSVCTVEADLQTAGGPYDKVILVGWYTDPDNSVELTMDQQSTRWILKQRSGGAVVAKASAHWPIQVGVSYHAKLHYDGTNLHLWVDGVSLILLPLATGGLAPGNFGFRVRNTTGTFQQIVVY